MKKLIEKGKYLIKTRVAKNLFWVTLGTGVGMIFGFVSNIYLARALLPDGFGKIMYAQTWVQYLMLIADFGLSTYALREIAKQKERLREFAQNVIPFRIAASLILFVLFSSISWFAFSSYEMKLLIIVSSLMIFTAALNVEWALQGLERMNLVGLSRVLNNAVPLILFLLFVKGPTDLLAVPLFRFLATLAATVFIFTFLRLRINIFNLDKRVIFDFLKASFHFWLLILIAQIYNGTDIIFLGIFRSPEEVGLYAAAFRAMSVLVMGLVLINTAVFPVLSDYGASDMRKFFILKKAYLAFSVLAGSLVVLLFVLIGDKLIILLFGEAYRNSIKIFQILIVGFAILMCNGPYAQSLLAKGFEKNVLLVVIVCATFNVVFNLIFIPRYGGLAAATSYVISQLIGTIWVAIIYYSKIKNRIIEL